MGGKRTSSLWIGAAFSLLIACGDDSSSMGSPDASAPESDESMSSDEKDAETSREEMMMATADSGGDMATKPPKGGEGGKGEPDETTKGEEPAKEQTEQTEFFSADPQAAGNQGFSNGASDSVGAAQAGAAGSGALTPATSTPTASRASASVVTSVDRGDIFRVLSDKRILNLNSYRGVQVIDVSDVNSPRIEGRLSVAGTPVEMYVVGDRAFVLLNGWQGYYGSRDDLNIRRASGGLVMSVDISDRANPKLIDQAEVRGNILTSRLTQGSGGEAALFVAANVYDVESHAIIKSFEVSSGELVSKDELDLGGYVQDVQATTELMLVASTDYTKMTQTSIVTVVDISHPDGTMVQGGSVTAQGYVQNKFNMDAYNGVLRVVSGANWNGSIENHLETFSLSDLQTLEPIDDCQLGHRDPTDPGSEQLYATVFVENRAFFVTYYRTDPFHAFSIDDDGNCMEHNEFIVSGWNDFLRAALDDTRLIGIGRNDQNNSRLLSVSLYDAVDLSNPTPLLARADITLEGAYSEANWDDRAFSVLEGAVSVNAPDGTEETGLVLLPFSGWDSEMQTSLAQVQLFTFSDRTLTKRGAMDHGTPVRRSFAVETDTTANLSNEQLSLFDTGNPDEPEELGRVDVAPNYSRVWVYGDYVARLRENTYYYSRPSGMSQQSQVQIVSAKGNVDANPTLASFGVPAGASLTQVGQLLVSVYTETIYDSTGQNPSWNSLIQVFDLSDAQMPKQRGSLTTDRLEPSYGGIYPAGGVSVRGGCFGCIYPRPMSEPYVVGEALVFPRTESHQKSQGFVTQCNTYPVNRNCSYDDEGNATCDNPYYSGGIRCITPDDGEEQCTGEFYLCDEKTGECEPTDPPDFSNRSCNRYEQFRYWQSYMFDTLDVRDPDAPTLAKRLELSTDEEGTSLLAVGETLYFNFQKPVSRPNDPRSYVKHYVRPLGFGDPQKPSVSDPINIPGDVIAAVDTTLYTRDFVWKDNDARALVARLSVKDGAARLRASQLFEDRQVSAVKLDGAGHVLVSSDPVSGVPVTTFGVGGVATAPSVGRVTPIAGSPAPAPLPIKIIEEPQSMLSILDDQDLNTIGEVDLDAWARFQDAQRGRALYQVPGGLLVIDVQDAMKPQAQAYFPVNGWPRNIVFDGDSILFAAGMYGIHRLDAGVFNLLMP